MTTADTIRRLAGTDDDPRWHAAVARAARDLGTPHRVIARGLGVPGGALLGLLHDQRWTRAGLDAAGKALRPEPVYPVWADFDALPGREWGRM